MKRMIIDAYIHLWNKVNGQLGAEKTEPGKDGIIRIGGKQIQGMPTWFSDCRNPAAFALSAFDDALIN